MTAALHFQNVSKSFNKHRKKVQALKNISFSIEEGEVFGFVGPNGAGKSTTIKVMLDIINDYEGDVTIYNVPARDARSRTGIAYVPESPAIYEQFTPLEVLRMAMRMYGKQPKDPDKWCLEWLDKLSVSHVAHRRMRQLSKGTVQRIAIAHALVSEPRLLVLDEPLSGLDPVGRKDVIDILLHYKESGGAIFFTSHVLHDVERIADRFGFINQGELVTIRSPREMVSNDTGYFIVRYQSDDDGFSNGRLLRSGEFEIELHQDELPKWLNKLNATGGRLINTQPSFSLEHVFFQILNENRTDHTSDNDSLITNSQPDTQLKND